MSGRTWKKFDPTESQLPTKFITACYTTDVKRELKRIREANPDQLKTPARALDRKDLAVVAILCDTRFTTLRGLNKHTEKMHGSISLRRLPAAIPIPTSHPTDTRTLKKPNSTSNPCTPATSLWTHQPRHDDRVPEKQTI